MLLHKLCKPKIHHWKTEIKIYASFFNYEFSGYVTFKLGDLEMWNNLYALLVSSGLYKNEKHLLWSFFRRFDKRLTRIYFIYVISALQRTFIGLHGDSLSIKNISPKAHKHLVNFYAAAVAQKLADTGHFAGAQKCIFLISSLVLPAWTTTMNTICFKIIWTVSRTHEFEPPKQYQHSQANCRPTYNEVTSSWINDHHSIS